MNPIAMVFVLIGLAIMAPLGVHYLNYQSRQTMATVAALQMARIQKAAEGYITTYSANIEGQATATNPVTITIPMLVNTGYLPNGFQASNPYGQTWEVQVLQPSAGQLQALVLSTGGQAVNSQSLGLAAQIAGSPGGVVGGGTGNTAVPGCAAGEACGVYAGWKVPTAYTAAQPGHLAALIEYSNGQVQNDYLYRVAVPGQPQLNQMQTNLDMGNNNVNNAQDVNVNQNLVAGGGNGCVINAQGHCEGQISAAGTTQADFPNGWLGGITTDDLHADDTVVAGPPGSTQAYLNDYANGSIDSGGQVVATSPNGADYAYMNTQNGGASIVTNGYVQGGYVNSTGNVNAQNALTAGGGGYITDSGYGAVANTFTANVLGANYIYSNGNINAGGQVQANYDATLGTAGGSANIGWGCSPNGAIAANANGSGQLLACVNGTWQSTGANSSSMQSYTYDYYANENVPGYWQFCVSVSSFGSGVWIYPTSGPYSNGTYTWATLQNPGQSAFASIFTCYNLPGVYVPGNP